MTLDQKSVKKIIYILFAAILFSWALEHIPFFYNVLTTLIKPTISLIIGGVLAFVLNIPMRFIEDKVVKVKKKKTRRALSVLITILLLFVVLGLILVLVIPELGRTFENIAKMIPGFVEDSTVWFNSLLERFPMFADYIKSIDVSLDSLGSSLLNFIKSGGDDVADFTVGLLGTLFGGALNLFLGFIFAAYILFDKENLGRQVRRLLYAYLPEKRVDQGLGVLGIIDRIFHSFVTGQLTEAVILGTMFVVAMFIFGFPYAVLVGVLVTITAIIPVVGAFIAMFIGAFLIFVVSPIQALWFVLLFLVLQQIEGNLIYPRVVGGSIGLPGLWVLAAVTIGGGLYGVLGVLLAVPISSVIYTLLKRDVANQLKVDKEVDKRKYQ